MLKLVLAPPDRNLLHERIAERFDAMLDAGFLDEVRALRASPELAAHPHPLDLPALRYAARINGLTSLALMKLDVLQGFHPLKVCTAYTWRGRTYEEMPTEPAAWTELVPVYAELPGFDADLRAARSPDDLPATARDYIERVSAWTGLPIEIVSVGPGRDENVRYGT